MDIRFTASQAVELVVPEQPIHIANYLRQPQRVVNALAASSQIETLDHNYYRLEMRPLSFMTLSIKPAVDLQVWADDAARVNVQSTRCELQNMEYINERFMLNLRGQLYPIQQHGTTYLKGQADLVVEVELPPPFLLTPRSLLETAGTSLLQNVLGTFKQRLLRQLILDYRHWVATQVATDYGSEVASTPVANS